MLVDIHVHVFSGDRGETYAGGNLSVPPDGFTLRAGVTTVVDAGSSGWRNFPDFKDRVIDRSKTRVLALLNIVGKGMGGGAIEQDVSDMDATATADQAKKYKDTVVGIKSAHFRGPEWICVERAVDFHHGLIQMNVGVRVFMAGAPGCYPLFQFAELVPGQAFSVVRRSAGAHEHAD